MVINLKYGGEVTKVTKYVLEGLKAIQQHPVKVCYKERSVGDYIADIVVEDKVIIELKSIEQLNKVHEV